MDGPDASKIPAAHCPVAQTAAAPVHSFPQMGCDGNVLMIMSHVGQLMKIRQLPVQVSSCDAGKQLAERSLGDMALPAARLGSSPHKKRKLEAALS